MNVSWQNIIDIIKRFKFAITLVLAFKKIESEDTTKYDNFYSSTKAELFLNESAIVDAFQSIYATIITNIQKPLEKVSDWIIDLVIDHTISIWKYNPLARSSYIKLPEELGHPRSNLVNIKKLMIINV